MPILEEAVVVVGCTYFMHGRGGGGVPSRRATAGKVLYKQSVGFARISQV